MKNYEPAITRIKEALIRDDEQAPLDDIFTLVMGALDDFVAMRRCTPTHCPGPRGQTHMKSGGGYPQEDVTFGQCMHQHSFCLSGKIPSNYTPRVGDVHWLVNQQWVKFLQEVADTIKMVCCGEPAIWNYPVADKGGNGSTIVQPITNSFLALDTWSDHNGAYLMICSCKQFDSKLLLPVFKRWELSVTGEVGHILRLG